MQHFVIDYMELPFEDAQMEDVYDGQVASPVISVITVPFHTKQLNCCPR